MLFGKPFTAAFGPTGAMIVSVKASEVAGALRAVVLVRPEYAERFFAVWVNEVLAGIEWCDEDAEFTVALPPNYGANPGSFYIQDVGRFPSFEEGDAEYLNWHAQLEGATTSQNLVFEWTVESLYSVSTVFGDTQLSSITVTGALRGVNVEDVPNFPTRGRLRYSLITVGTTRILRWWNGNTLVAEGSRTGDGAVSCTEIEGSGIIIAATITYTGVVDKNDAWLDVKWPALYQIHYSTSALSFPRTPEDEVLDNGGSKYGYAKYGLTPGTYNVNVVPVDDEGTPQSAPSTPADSPLTISTVPAKPTIQSISGSAAAGITFTFTNGEAGCTYTLYYSKKNEPINFGDLTGPTPVTTALNATTVTTAAIADTASVDRETAYNTLVSAWDSAISTANTAFDGVASVTNTFNTSFATLSTAILSALDTFIGSVGYPLIEKRQQISDNAASVQAFLDAAQATTLETLTEWKTQAGTYYGTFLRYLGGVLDGNPDSWTLPNGALAGSLLGAETTGTSEDGALGDNTDTQSPIRDVIQPFVKAAKFYAVIRATKSSVEEKNGDVYEFELDNSGAIVATRPNKAQIEAVSIDGLDVTVTGGIFEDDAAAPADELELYIYTGSISIGSPNEVATLPTGTRGYKTVTFPAVTVGGAGWYKIAVFGLSADGGRSLLYDEQYVQIDTAAPSGVLNLRVYVARSKGR